LELTHPPCKQRDAADGGELRAARVATPARNIKPCPAPLACRFNPADDACTLPHLKVATIKQLLGQLNSFLIIVTGNDLRWPRDAIAGEQRVNPIVRHAALPYLRREHYRTLNHQRLNKDACR
jgi:hypothetical protein